MITIVPHQPAWREEFVTIGASLRKALGGLALRIDHIGSTAVPGLAAKDIIDIQITVLNLSQEVEQALHRAGFTRLAYISHDHIPPGNLSPPSEWIKWVFRLNAMLRPVNVHVRVTGHTNQRYPLLFRDYLRRYPSAAQAYTQVKEALAKYHSGNSDAYYEVKDPVCDLIIGGAEIWAAATGWEPGPSDG